MMLGAKFLMHDWHQQVPQRHRQFGVQGGTEDVTVTVDDQGWNVIRFRMNDTAGASEVDSGSAAAGQRGT